MISVIILNLLGISFAVETIERFLKITHNSTLTVLNCQIDISDDYFITDENTAEWFVPNFGENHWLEKDGNETLLNVSRLSLCEHGSLCLRHFQEHDTGEYNSQLIRFRQIQNYYFSRLLLMQEK